MSAGSLPCVSHSVPEKMKEGGGIWDRQESGILGIGKDEKRKDKMIKYKSPTSKVTNG